MSPLPRSAPAVRRLMGGQTPPPLLLLLLLLLCIPAAQGDCSLPPDVPNAQPDLRGLASFPEQTTITYKCNKGFVKVPGMADSVLCLNDKWSEVAEFCNRSCDVPTRLHFASLKKSYSKQNYFPEGFTVEYECRKGYKRDLTLSEKLTCLQNFTWSKPDEFCKKKQCPTPGELKNGHVNITTDLLFGASIFFSCNAGYRLVGATSSYCFAIANDVEWSDPLPECQEISPTVKAIPAVEKPITVNFPATKYPAIPRATTSFHSSTSKNRGNPSSGMRIMSSGTMLLIAGGVAVIIIIVALILAKGFWHYGKSGSYHTHENNKAVNVAFYNLPATGDAADVRPGN
uniref:CD55 molecule (Cromer blood group) n=1 Tax=Sus scrofa TaxID=9823 RepID=A0A8D1RK80_PIG